MPENEPYIFVPRSRLEIPEDYSSEVLLGLLDESGYMEARLRSLPMSTLNWPHVPEWRPWEDNSGGTIHLHDADSHDELPTQYRNDNSPFAPPNKDGSSFRNGEKQILTYAVRLTPKLLGVLWGVTSAPIQELNNEPGHISLTRMTANSKGLRNYFNLKFSE